MITLIGSIFIALSLLLPVDYDCDGEVTVNDALISVAHHGSNAYPDLYVYDQDRDGDIDVDDMWMVVDRILEESDQPFFCPTPYPVYDYSLKKTPDHLDKKTLGRFGLFDPVPLTTSE